MTDYYFPMTDEEILFIKDTYKGGGGRMPKTEFRRLLEDMPVNTKMNVNRYSERVVRSHLSNLNARIQETRLRARKINTVRWVYKVNA